MMNGKNNQGDTHIMTFMRSYGSTIFDEEGNFDFESKETVQALEWIDISAGNIPACKSVAEKYKDQIPMLDEFVSNAVHVVDFMNNSPNWQGDDTSVRSVFWPNIHELLSETITPQECTKALNDSCNAALQTGREKSKLHE